MADSVSGDSRSADGDERELRFSEDEWAVFAAFLKAERERPLFLDGVEYWLWDGDDLRPATTEESERLRERDLAYFARLRFERWRREHERRRYIHRFTSLYQWARRWLTTDAEDDVAREHAWQAKRMKWAPVKPHARRK